MSEPKTRTGYMCKIDFDYELGHADSNKIYDSVESLKADHGCVDECGIVEVTVTLTKVIKEGSY